jgi:hypothetical protein
MSQLVQGAEINLRKPYPLLPVGGCPKVAGQTAGEALASIVDLDKLLEARAICLEHDRLRGRKS